MFKYGLEFRRKALKLYVQGNSAVSIGRLMGCAHNTILKWAKEKDICRTFKEAAEIRKPVYDSNFRKMAIERYASGLSSTNVAKELGCSNRTVLDWATEAGIKRSISEALKVAGIIPPSQKGVKRSMETRLKLSGDKNHFWRGGVAPLQKRIRMSLRYRDWRTEVFERDDYICQKCGEFSVAGARLRLNAHHRTPFIELLTKFELDTFEKAMACEELWNVENGVTLCVGCH